MALGKYTRVDNRRSPASYCSTVTIVVFVALCLVGVWMLTSSSVVPVQNVDAPQEDNKSEVTDKSSELNDQANQVTEQVTDTKDSNTSQFEDNPGDLPDDATKGNSMDTSSQTEGDSNSAENQYQNQEEKTVLKTEQKESSEEDTKSEDSDNRTEGEESNSETEETKKDSGKDGEMTKSDSDTDKKSGSDENEKEESSGETEIEEKVDQTDNESSDESLEKKDDRAKDQSPGEVYPSGAQSELLKETTTQNGGFSTQAAESRNEKDESSKQSIDYSWKLCNVTAGPDYIPCLDNWKAIKSLRSTKHYEHRERHCPDNAPTCLVSLPEGYRRSVEWPKSREKIWYYNVPHTKLAQVKGHQNWVKVAGEYLTFPGGGTQFKHGALHYIDFIQESVPDIAWGKRTRVILDVGCGVASFGGFLFDRGVLAMSFAPKDEHEAQVQFALERGIPAISAVMGTTRLPYPARVFDIVHCARCRVPWHIEGGKLLLELNRVLRPGGFFVWSATPVYQKLDEDVQIWNAMSELTKAMCWELISINKDTVNGVGIATFKKPTSNECYENRAQAEPPLCPQSDDPNAAWNVPLRACMHKAPTEASERGYQWPVEWPARLEKSPYWLLSSQVGVYGKAAPDDFTEDYEHWKRVVSRSYLTGIGIDWSNVRNVMDMKAVYGGFAAALRERDIWVMNVVNINEPDTLPIIYERGLFGIYHDWCESFSTYPRSYDLVHADHLFSQIKKRCNLAAVVAEVDRILRPEGKLIVRDDVETIGELENMFKSMKWEVRLTYSKDKEGLFCVQKSMWRPSESEMVSYAIA